MKNPLRLGVLISGRGSNLQAIIESIEDSRLNASVNVVISNVEDAQGLHMAREQNLPAFFVNPEGPKTIYEEKIVSTLKEHNVELVVLAGYMKIVGKNILEAYHHRIINIHPSLLPSFPGLNAQKQAIEHGVKVSGCTVHFVDAGMDTGKIILQTAVPVLEGDTEDSLSQRILREEHQLYYRAIGLIASKV